METDVRDHLTFVTSGKREVPVLARTVGEKPHIATIDGLRAIANLVAAVHLYTPWILHVNGPLSQRVAEAAEWMGSGVDLFFVLSGFLITGILVDARGTSNYCARFYWRRSRAFFPPITRFSCRCC